jgi:hypothetical protein
VFSRVDRFMHKITFPIKTVSEANQREHWRKKHDRKKSQQLDFTIFWRKAKPAVELPARFVFTRYSCRLLDSDNLAGAFKHVRDQLAKEIGIDDGSDKLTFVYQQERISKREHYFTLEVV